MIRPCPIYIESSIICFQVLHRKVIDLGVKLFFKQKSVKSIVHFHNALKNFFFYFQNFYFSRERRTCAIAYIHILQNVNKVIFRVTSEN